MAQLAQTRLAINSKKKLSSRRYISGYHRHHLNHHVVDAYMMNFLVSYDCQIR